MALFGHVLKRLFLAFVGYVAALLVSLFMLSLLYAAASSMPGASDRFTIMAVSPYLAVAVPSVALFAVLLTAVLTGAQAAVTILLSEIFGLRALWLHMVFGALVSASAYLLVAPVAAAFADLIDMAEAAIFALAGAAGGLAYWLIAGRRAGLRPASP